MARPESAQKLEIVRRRERIETLLATGLESSYQVADALAREGIQVDARTVQRDIQAIEAEWRERYVEKRNQRKLRQVREAEWRKAELRSEWERSKKDKERSRQKEVKPGARPAKEGGEDAVETGRIETEAAVEGRLADVAYMREIRENDAHVADLLGLYEPTRHAIGGDPDAPPVQTKSEDDLTPHLAAVRTFMAAVVGAGGPPPAPDGAGQPLDPAAPASQAGTVPPAR